MSVFTLRTSSSRGRKNCLDAWLITVKRFWINAAVKTIRISMLKLVFCPFAFTVAFRPVWLNLLVSFNSIYPYTKRRVHGGSKIQLHPWRCINDALSLNRIMAHQIVHQSASLETERFPPLSSNQSESSIHPGHTHACLKTWMPNSWPMGELRSTWDQLRPTRWKNVHFYWAAR